MDIEQKGKVTAKIVSVVSMVQAPIPGRRVFVEVFSKKENKTFCSMIIGKGRKNNGFDFKRKAIEWLKANTDALVSAESNDAFIKSVGAISGRDYIISVSGGFPKDNLALAIILLVEVENEPVDLLNRDGYVEKAQCEKEMDSLLNYLSTNFSHDFLMS